MRGFSIDSPIVKQQPLKLAKRSTQADNLGEKRNHENNRSLPPLRQQQSVNEEKTPSVVVAPNGLRRMSTLHAEAKVSPVKYVPKTIKQSIKKLMGGEESSAPPLAMNQIASASTQ